MILVDSSVWIGLLRGGIAPLPQAQLVRVATCGPIIQEVFQGLRDGHAAQRFRGDFLALPVLSDPLPSPLFAAAAEIFRSGRAKGFTIRSPADCLIAAVAIANDVAIWHRDRDFDVIARFTPLRLVPAPGPANLAER